MHSNHLDDSTIGQEQNEPLNMDEPTISFNNVNLNSEVVKQIPKEEINHSCSIEDKLLRRWMLAHSGAAITG